MQFLDRAMRVPSTTATARSKLENLLVWGVHSVGPVAQARCGRQVRARPDRCERVRGHAVREQIPAGAVLVEQDGARTETALVIAQVVGGEGRPEVGISVGAPGRVLHCVVGPGAPGVRGRDSARVDGESFDVHQAVGHAVQGRVAVAALWTTERPAGRKRCGGEPAAVFEHERFDAGVPTARLRRVGAGHGMQQPDQIRLV